MIKCRELGLKQPTKIIAVMVTIISPICTLPIRKTSQLNTAIILLRSFECFQMAHIGLCLLLLCIRISQHRTICGAMRIAWESQDETAQIMHYYLCTKSVDCSRHTSHLAHQARSLYTQFFSLLCFLHYSAFHYTVCNVETASFRRCLFSSVRIDFIAVKERHGAMCCAVLCCVRLYVVITKLHLYSNGILQFMHV